VILGEMLDLQVGELIVYNRRIYEVSARYSTQSKSASVKSIDKNLSFCLHYNGLKRSVVYDTLSDKDKFHYKMSGKVPRERNTN